jgi:hypothetical protein
MAIARCDLCESPKGRTQRYVLPVEPVGYPKSSTVCGSRGCENPAQVWLNQKESDAYYDGQRVFAFATAAVKVKVKGPARVED